jgi:hypothetical protein
LSEANQGSQIEQRDLWLPSLYISAAAVIVAVILPVSVQFQPQPAWSIGAALAGTAVVLAASARGIMPLLFVGVAWLLAVAGACVISQPSVLSVPVVAVWPIRLALVLVVALPWALLMRPPRLVVRAILGFAVPTFLAILVWGGPATAAATFGWQYYVPPRSFSPLWLAVGGQGTLYATDARFGLVWVFDSQGNPKGTIRPAMAPDVPTPGPGIFPVGFEEEIHLSGMGLVPTATPRSGVAISGYLSTLYFNFCGVIADAQDNLYTVDLVDASGFKLLRFDRNGNITARWPLPQGYSPISNCLAADSANIYVGDHENKVYVLDYEGRVIKEIKLSFMPYGLSSSGPGKLTAISANSLAQVDVATGQVETASLSPTQGEYQIPFLVRHNGETLVTNHTAGEVVRLDSKTGQVLGTIGQRGFMPGQFGEIAGLAEDAQGRIYVSDWRHHVIQRFTPEGRIDSVWWATLTTSVPGEEGEIE